jgi:subtilisin-like proprotein convertase family protein
MAIPNPGSTASTISVPDSFVITDVDVRLNVAHTSVGNLDAYVVSPNGTRVDLFSRWQTSGSDLTDTVLDDEAPASLLSGSAPYTGRFLPESALAALDGEDTLGEWTLHISDAYRYNKGSLMSWSVELAGVCGVPVDRPVSGQRMKVKDKEIDPSRRLLFVKSSDPSILASSRRSAADPTSYGASLTLFNPATEETDTYDLPAALWRPLGTASRPLGYRYRDSRRTVGPCSKVEIKNGKRFSASCRREGIRFSLDEPAQGSLGVVFSTGGLRHCVLFGGEVRKDFPTAGRVRGQFMARNALPPSDCPPLP